MGIEDRGFAVLARTGEAEEIIGAEESVTSSVLSTVYKAGAMVSGPACAYHGYKRNQSIGWALWWGFAGSVFFPVAPAIAFAQGFGQPHD